MSVRRRGRSWVVTAYSPVRGFSCHIGTFPSHQRACEADELVKAGTYQRPRSACPRGLPRVPVIYYVEAPELNLVKVGFSTDITKRFSHLARNAPVDLRLAYFIEGDRALEQQIHGKLAAYRARGEWFRIEGALADFLHSLRSNRPFGGSV